MFSGLTNQVTSWMGAAKGEPQDEEVPTPTKDATGETTAEGEKQSPTKGGSKLDLITNVKSQMTGWLGSGIPIPGLKKNETAPTEATEPAPVEPAEVAEPKPETKDDDDNSRYNSATGGADSRPASTGGTPTEEQPGGVGNGPQSKKLFNVDNIEVPDMQELTTKAVAGAKSLGNFLYSAVNKAGAKVSEASAKIKKTVEENDTCGRSGTGGGAGEGGGCEVRVTKARHHNFLQTNLNHCAQAQDLLMQVLAQWQIDVAVAAEPYYVPPSHPCWAGDSDGSVAIVGRSDSGPTLSVEESGSGYVVVKWREYAVIGAYFSLNRTAAELKAFMDILAAAVDRQAPRQFLVLGDLNAEVRDWGDPSTDTRGEIVREWAVTTGLTLLNAGSAPTCERRDGRSTVDVSFAAPSLAARVRAWRVLAEEETLLDYKYVRFEISSFHDRGSPCGQAAIVPRRAVRRLDAELAREKAIVRMWCAGSRRPDVDVAADRLREVVTVGCKMSTPHDRVPRRREAAVASHRAVGRFDAELAREKAIVRMWCAGSRRPDANGAPDRLREEVTVGCGDAAAPQSQRSAERRQPSWWSSEIADLRAASNAARRRYLRCRRRRRDRTDEQMSAAELETERQLCDAYHVANRQLQEAIAGAKARASGEAPAGPD